MAWRKVWRQKRNGARRGVGLLRWYDDFGAMKAKTFSGDARAADEECRRLEQELNDGTLGRRRDVEWLTFCEEFLADLTSHSRARTVDDYRDTLRGLTEHCCPQRVSQVTTSLLREFVRVRSGGRSPATRNKLVRTLRAIFSWAVPEYLKENPASGVRFIDEPEVDKRTLAPTEFDRVMEVIDDRGRVILLLGTCCGLRREEMAFLRWEDLDLDQGHAPRPEHRVAHQQERQAESGPDASGARAGLAADEDCVPQPIRVPRRVPELPGAAQLCEANLVQTLPRRADRGARSSGGAGGGVGGGPVLPASRPPHRPEPTDRHRAAAGQAGGPSALHPA